MHGKASVAVGVVQLQGQWLAQSHCVRHTYTRQVEAKFKVLWADHGDAVSQQYAGAPRVLQITVSMILQHSSLSIVLLTAPLQSG